MGIDPDHFRHAQHNEEFISTIRSNSAVEAKFLDWIVTTIFYVAVHYIDGTIKAESGLEVSSHDLRRDLVKTMPVFDRMRDAYFRLYSAARASRYDPSYRFQLNKAYVDTLQKDKLGLIKKELVT